MRVASTSPGGRWARASTSWRTCAASSIPWAPARSGGWWTATRACSGTRTSWWPTRRSCRRSRASTPTFRRSRWRSGWGGGIQAGGADRARAEAEPQPLDRGRHGAVVRLEHAGVGERREALEGGERDGPDVLGISPDDLAGGLARGDQGQRGVERSVGGLAEAVGGAGAVLASEHQL